MLIEDLSLVIATFLIAVNSQGLYRLGDDGEFFLKNNSFVAYTDIGIGNFSLKCLTQNRQCCNDGSVGNWRDVRGSPVQEGSDGTSCRYVTRGDGEISLNRKSGCFDHTSGLWRCDIPDSRGNMQSFYIYISNDVTYYDGKRINFLKAHTSINYMHDIVQLLNITVHFTLHTDPRAEVPEFTISCRTYGGPATTVQWTVNGWRIYGQTSKLILDASHNSVYDNRLRVRGKRTGYYRCAISNGVGSPLEHTRLVTSMIIAHCV